MCVVEGGSCSDRCDSGAHTQGAHSQWQSLKCTEGVQNISGSIILCNVHMYNHVYMINVYVYTCMYIHEYLYIGTLSFMLIMSQLTHTHRGRMKQNMLLREMYWESLHTPLIAFPYRNSLSKM